MEILGYGEDALTLWAMKYKLSDIFSALHDPSNPSRYQVFFRPSFGRAGGEKSPQFGEFDFIILAENKLYLGESKWDHSSEKKTREDLRLRPEQLLRHKLFRCLVQAWLDGTYPDWRSFINTAKACLQKKGINKPVAPENSLLAANLETILNIIKAFYHSIPQIENVLLYFCNDTGTQWKPLKAGEDFRIVTLDYSKAANRNYIQLNL